MCSCIWSSYSKEIFLYPSSTQPPLSPYPNTIAPNSVCYGRQHCYTCSPIGVTRNQWPQWNHFKGSFAMAVSVTTQILITLHLIALHPEGRPFWKKCVSNLGWPLKRTVTSIKTQWCGSICLLPTPTPTHKPGDTLIFCLPSHWQLIVKLFLLLALLSPAQESPSLRSYSPFKQHDTWPTKYFHKILPVSMELEALKTVPV